MLDDPPQTVTPAGGLLPLNTLQVGELGFQVSYAVCGVVQGAGVGEVGLDQLESL